jgi:hypothetical protein
MLCAAQSDELGDRSSSLRDNDLPPSSRDRQVSAQLGLEPGYPNLCHVTMMAGSISHGQWTSRSPRPETRRQPDR